MLATSCIQSTLFHQSTEKHHSSGRPDLEHNIEQVANPFLQLNKYCQYRVIGGDPSVGYGAGLGGFARTRPHPSPALEGHFSGNPRPAPVQGPPLFIHRTGPRLRYG